MEKTPDNNTDIHFLVVGNGRLAKHFCHYFDLSAVSYIQCKREDLNEFSRLTATIGNSESLGRILLLINDDQIQSFIETYKQTAPSDLIWIHCSGLLSIAEAESAHPLASFSKVLFPDDYYQTIPFVTERGKMGFRELFPQLPNPCFEISKEQKELYHARCSIAGNFTTILWQNFFQYLQAELHMPEQMAYPYLQSVLDNLLHSDDPLTGPIKRGDTRTIDRHLSQVKDTPLEDVYMSFINLYENRKI